jgi:hypothetical protein
MVFRKIRKAYYLTKNNKIVQVVVLWDGVTRSGKNMAKVTLWGNSEEEAFWVPARRVAWFPEALEKVRKELQDSGQLANCEESMKKENS